MECLQGGSGASGWSLRNPGGRQEVLCAPWGRSGDRPREKWVPKGPLPISFKSVMFSILLSILLIPGTRGCVTTPPNPFYHVYIGNSFKLLCHVDFRQAIKMSHLVRQGSLPGPPGPPLGPSEPFQAPVSGILFLYILECPGAGHPRYI